MSLEGDRLDYLKAKYIFRYPFTIKAIKWAGTIGIFIALHTFIKNRSLQKTFESWVWGTTLTVFPIWGFFMAKYNFYEESIEIYEKDENEKINQANALKKFIEYKLELPFDHDFSEEELVDRYK